MKTIRLLLFFLLFTVCCFCQTKEDFFEAGKNDLEKGWLITAVDYFSDAIKLDSNFANAYYYRGLTYIKGAMSDCYMPAVNDFYKCIALQPDSNFWEAYSYIASQKLFPDTSALKYYDKAIKLNPTNYLLYQKRGFLKQWNRMLSSAYQDYLKSVEINKADVKSYDLMTNIDLQNGHYISALKQVDIGIEQDPESAKLYFTKTEVLCRLNKKKEAKKAYRKALKKAEKTGEFVICSCCEVTKKSN